MKLPEEELNAYQRGYATREELEERLPPQDKLEGKRLCIIECMESISCNPCAEVCPVDAISKEGLCKPGVVDWDKCTGCAQCVAICPALSIFIQQIKDGKGFVTMAYEQLPEPEIGDKAQLFNRSGNLVGEGRIVKPTFQAKGDSYPGWVVTVEMDDPDLSYEVRAIKISK